MIETATQSAQPRSASAQPLEISSDLTQRFGDAVIARQPTRDGIPTLWITAQSAPQILAYLKNEAAQPFQMLLDLAGVDERARQHREALPESDFTLVYHLMAFDRNEDIRLKVPLKEDNARVPTVSGIWPNANWYEREAWDMFGIEFEGHPNLLRILCPPTWQGHALRKDHPARATEMDPYSLDEDKTDLEQEALKFVPEEWGMQRKTADSEFMFLNLGPNHPSVHGVFRIALQLDGEQVVDAVPDIGYHHRGAEKMGERQSWHTFIPYTDRVDYLGGVNNNFPYVMAVEKLAGIQVPERVKVMRVMVAEMYRIASHLLFYGTFAQDVGQLSPIFYMFVDREKLFGLIEALTGARMHASWFRIGGVASDLPEGWDTLVREWLAYMPARMKEYDGMVMDNSILKKRTIGIGEYTTQEALDWGITGPGLRATGLDWDYRKNRSYSGYDQFDFEVPVGTRSDCYQRCAMRVEEIRQSLRIIEQCLDNMPEGPYKAEHPQATPPPKDRALHDIETLIQHFLNVSWGPVIPPGEACVAVEGTKGINSYYLTSDGSTMSYRTRIRTPSFAHLQMIPLMSRGLYVADLIAIIASIDFVMADVDR